MDVWQRLPGVRVQMRMHVRSPSKPIAFSSHAGVRGPRARNGRPLGHGRRFRGPEHSELDAVRPSGAVRRRRAGERADHDVGRRAAERDRPPSGCARHVPGDRHDHAVQRRKRHHRRRERLPRPARVRPRRRGRPRHRELRRLLGQLRHPRAARRLRGGRVGGAAAVEQRRRRHVGLVLHGDHADLHRGAAAAAPEGDLPDRPDERLLPRHGLAGRPEQHRLHPVLAGARLGGRPRSRRHTR